MRSVPPMRERHPEDRRPRNGLRILRTPRLPSDGWPRRCLAPANSMRSRRGCTSRHCEGPGRASPPRPGGVRHTTEPPATKGRQAGQDRGGGARHPRGGMAVLLGPAEARALPLPRSLAHLKRGISERSGRRHGSGQQAGIPGRDTRCRRARSRTTRCLRAPRGLPRGITR